MITEDGHGLVILSQLQFCYIRKTLSSFEFCWSHNDDAWL